MYILVLLLCINYKGTTTSNNLIAGTIMYIRIQQPFVIEDAQFIFITFQRKIYTKINEFPGH